MKKGIHPTYHKDATVTCACGAVLTAGSTVKAMATEICAHCHPFYTGKKKVVDTTGRVDRFKKMAERSATMQAAKTAKKARAKKEKEAAASVLEKAGQAVAGQA